jgi:hypothetical protein
MTPKYNAASGIIDGDTDVSISVIILVNVIMFSVIGFLRDDTLSTGILDVIFPSKIVSCVYFCKRIYS